MRRSRVRHDVGWLSTDRRCPGEPRCPGLAKIGVEVEWAGKTSRARRTDLSSAAPGAAPFARAVHAHRGIENRPHRVLDVVFHDDLMRPRTDGGPANMATNRHAALDIIKAIPTKALLQGQPQGPKKDRRMERRPRKRHQSERTACFKRLP